MSTLDKHMLKELLLVCSALGSLETLGGGDDQQQWGQQQGEQGQKQQQQRFVRGENCLEWLQDLQRALRRDDDNTREICITISSWRVVQQKVVPLILECRDDGVLIKTILKIYVMLTMPLSKQASEALLKPVNPKAQGDVRDQQARRRENALAQQAALHAFKRSFISKDILSVIVGMLEEPLSHIGVARTDDDNFSIELCLTLLRNILTIHDPAQGLGTSLGDHYSQMHEQLIALFHDALLLDILLLLAQDVHARENTKLNLLLVEIFYCIIKDQEPGAIITVHREQMLRKALKGNKGLPVPLRPTGASLMSILAKEKDKRGLAAGQMHSRHTRFGGALQIGGGDGATARIVANPFKDRVDCVPQATRKKTKRSNIFSVDGLSGNSPSQSESNKAIAAREALYEFCCSFLKTAYDPFMRSIKNEFRIDSSRLQPGDKGMMFRLMHFFMSLHHQLHKVAVKDAAGAGRKASEKLKFELGYILETMDLMSFNLVLREAETAISEKNTTRLAECVAALKEMMHIVSMLNESSEKAHQLVALGLLARIFYSSEPLDKLNDIVRNWQPGKYTKIFLCHLVELVHTTLKTLEWFRNSKAKHIGGVDASTINGEGVKGQVDKAVVDRVIAAKGFDFERYFRRLATNHTVRMYTNLLEHYATNSARTNHYILSFMMRLSTFTGGNSSKKRRGKSIELDDEELNDRKSFEPMLYNVYTLGVFQKILDDPLARKPTYKHLVHFILSVVRNFGTLTQKNQLVFVEALFQHPNPQPFCETLWNVYHDASYGDTEPKNHEPKKKRAPKTGESDEESESEDEEYEPSFRPTTDSPTLRTGANADEANEEEWNEQSVKTAEEASGGEEVPGDERRKSNEARRRGAGKKANGDGSSKKKRAPRWTKEEDSYLRLNYPIYADTGSAFAVLSTSDEMEVKHRTEEQIQARVKKLGLETTYDSSDGGVGMGESKRNMGPGDDDTDADRSQNGEEGENPSKTEGRAPASPVHVRRIERKQAQSDDDSEGLFSSVEDNIDQENAQSENAETEISSPATAARRPDRRAILEESSDEE